VKDSSNSKCLKSLCVERKYEQIIHKLNRKILMTRVTLIKVSYT
jgi:hypothetical protein